MSNPFKHLDYYKEEDAGIFRGRKQEAWDILKLTVLNNPTVVFGKSGSGKTSLINAGVFPLLKAENYLPVPIHFNYSDSQTPLVQQISKTISQVLEKSNQDGQIITLIDQINWQDASSIQDNETLWEYFHRVHHVDEKKKLVTPVLVFDQFEKFLIDSPPDQQEQVAKELYYLLDNRVPQPIHNKFLEDGTIFPYIHTQIALRVLLVLREDYLPHLSSLKKIIPSITRVSYRVTHMNGLQAREVISLYEKFSDKNPQGKKTQDDILKIFDSKKIQEGKEEDIEVEPSLLSLLCFRMVEEGLTLLSAQKKDEILSDFYEKAIKNLNHKKSKEVAELIETQLLTDSGSRRLYPLDPNDELYQGLKAAINQRILRQEHHNEKDYVEIIHDVLASVILEKKRLRKEKDIQTKENLRKTRIYAAIITILLIISIILGVKFLNEKQKANRQYEKALINRVVAESYLALSKDNKKSIRIAEMAYRLKPSASSQKALAMAAYSSLKTPFYTMIMEHKNNITSVLISPGGSHILTTALDNTTTLWDFKGNRVAQLASHPTEVKYACFSPNGKNILALYRDKTAKLFDLQGNIRGSFDKYLDNINRATFLPDSTKILLIPYQGNLKILDLESNSIIELTNETVKIGWDAIFSPDQSRFITLSNDNTVRLWQSNGSLIADLKHNAMVSCITFSPDSQKIVTCCSDTIVRLWDVNGQLIKELKGHTASVWNAAFSPDNTQLISASTDRTARLWNLNDYASISLEHDEMVQEAIFSPDGKNILSISGNTGHLWTSSGKRLTRLEKHQKFIKKAFFSLDSKRILTSSPDSVVLWDLNGAIMAYLRETSGDFSHALLSTDGKKIITTSANQVKIWDLENNPAVNIFHFNDRLEKVLISPDATRALTWSQTIAQLTGFKNQSLTRLDIHLAPILNASFSPYRDQVLTASWDNTAILWDFQGQPLREFKLSAQVRQALFCPPDGRQILTLTDDNLIKLWDENGNFEIVNLLADLNINAPDHHTAQKIGPKNIIDGVALSANGELLLTWYGNSVFLRELHGKVKQEFKHNGLIQYGIFSPDNTMILVVFQDKNNQVATLWKVDGQRLADIKRHSGTILTAAFSPDGSQLLTASDDQTAKLWDKEGNLLADLDQHDSAVLCAAFSRDGESMVTVTQNGSVKRWLTPHAIIKWLEDKPIPALSEKDKDDLDLPATKKE